MNSPYMGKFKVTQAYRGDSVHDGLDLVEIDSKEIHATVSGTVLKRTKSVTLTIDGITYEGTLTEK